MSPGGSVTDLEDAAAREEGLRALRRVAIAMYPEGG